MQNTIKNIFIIILCSYSCCLYSQTDTIKLNEQWWTQNTSENKFIDLLKNNKIDSCLQFFSSNVINEYGIIKLQKELKKLNKYFNKYPNLDNSTYYGQSYNGVGTFGHDNNGNFEKKSSYIFRDKKGNVVYYFDLYYTESSPITIIKNFDSMGFSDLKPIKNVKPIIYKDPPPN